MSATEISQYLRGKVFQAGSYHAAALVGEVIYFTEEDNEYYWFCSAMDQQSRIRAEYGVWGLEGGFMTTTTLKMIEWVDGHFTKAYGSTGSRYELEGYNQVLTDVDIEQDNNFRVFRFSHDGYGEEMGFYWSGWAYYYCPAVARIDDLKEYYGEYFSMFG